MWETQVQLLDWEDPLEKGMTIHSNILAWRIRWTEEPGGYSPWNPKQSDTTNIHSKSLGETRNKGNQESGEHS